MSDTIARPTFYEGEILPATDLIASVDAARGQLARHERYVHRWGIVTGLRLKGTKTPDKNGVNYMAVSLTEGMALDGSGREIIVVGEVPLNPADFAFQVNGKKDLWYPVFLSGRDENAASSSLLTGACTSSLPTQVKENYDISYGTPGAEQSLDEQTAPGITDGPADGVTSGAWLVLLGFVQWDPVRSLFIAVQDTNADGTVGRRYVGVNAADVVAGGGTLQLATHPTGSPDAKTVMALEIHETNDGELVFGKQNPDGSVSSVFTVDSKGDLTISGKFTSAVKPGSIQVQSGIASDGIILPLPPGVTAADKADLHIEASLRLNLDDYPRPPSALLADTWIVVPLECFVDDFRQVHCRIRWMKIPMAVADMYEAAGLCDYTIVASVAATGG